MIYSIRKGSVDGDERITVEYQFRQNEILNVQEKAKFNELPSADFSQVTRIQLANINLMYKLGTLKLPKLIKKYRSGKVIEQQSVFNSADVNYGGDKSYAKIIRMTPQWDTCTPELSYWDEGYMVPVRDYDNYVDDFFDELP
jgi:hypothetical protein